MWHVDEGALHAWLDGELDAFPRDEAERIRAHLESCPSCAARLAEERAVRDAAEGILASAPVDLTGLPTLEEMRARARAGAPGGAGGRGGRMQRLAWAASVVLAVGAGWMARGIYPGVEAPGRDSLPPMRAFSETELRRAGEPGPEAGPVVTAADVTAEDAATAEVMADRQATPGGAAARSVAAGSEGADEGGRGREAPATERTRTGEASTAAAPAPVTSAPAAPVTGALAPAAETEKVAVAREAAAAESLAAQRRLDAVPAGEEGRFELAGLILPSTLADQAAGGGAVPTLSAPGLPILSVGYPVPDDPGSGLTVRQLLPTGDTLEVHHLTGAETPETLGPVPDGIAQWTAARDGGWLVLRGGSDPEALRRLGEAMRGGGGS